MANWEDLEGGLGDLCWPGAVAEGAAEGDAVTDLEGWPLPPADLLAPS
jgi:hypothetical protein